MEQSFDTSTLTGKAIDLKSLLRKIDTLEAVVEMLKEQAETLAEEIQTERLEIINSMTESLDSSIQEYIDDYEED